MRNTTIILLTSCLVALSLAGTFEDYAAQKIRAANLEGIYNKFGGVDNGLDLERSLSEILKMQQITRRQESAAAYSEFLKNIIFGERNNYRALNNFKIIADQVRQNAEKAAESAAEEIKSEVPQVQIPNVQAEALTGNSDEGSKSSDDVSTDKTEEAQTFETSQSDEPEETAEEEETGEDEEANATLRRMMTRAVRKIEAPALSATHDKPIRIMGKKAATYVLSNFESAHLAGKVTSMKQLMETSEESSAIFHFKSAKDYMMKIMNKLIPADSLKNAEFFSTQDGQAVGYDITGQEGPLGRVEATIISPKVDISEIPAGKHLAFFRSVDNGAFSRIQSVFDEKHHRVVSFVPHALGVYALALVDNK